MLSTFLQKNLSNVGSRTEERIYIIIMYLYNKNILEYAENVVTDGNSRILYIEGHSIRYNLLLKLHSFKLDFSFG